MFSFARTLAAGLLGLGSFAHAGVAVVVSADSSIGPMSADDVAKIFLGKSSKTPDGASVTAYDQLEGEAVRDEFYDKAAGRSASQLKAYWSKLVFTGKGEPPKSLDPEELAAELADDPNAIGYVDSSAVPAGLKAVLTLD